MLEKVLTDAGIVVLGAAGIVCAVIAAATAYCLFKSK